MWGVVCYNEHVIQHHETEEASVYHFYLTKKLTFSNEKIKDITVKNSLHDSSYNGDEVIMIFKIIAVDPVEEIQGTIRAKRKEIMRRDALCLASL
jgi:hypothetical protein